MRFRLPVNVLIFALACVTTGCAKNHEKSVALFLYALATKVDFAVDADGAATHEPPETFACGEEVFKVSSYESGGTGSFLATYAANSAGAGTSDTTADFVWAESELIMNVDGGGLTDNTLAATSSSTTTVNSTLNCKFKMQFEAYSAVVGTEFTLYTPSTTVQITDCAAFSCVADGQAIDCAKLNTELAKIRSCDDHDE